jgi:hypothetical protein
MTTRRLMKTKQDFVEACVAYGLPAPVTEYQFALDLHPPRKWAFDFLFDGWLAVEKNGGLWIAGRHNRGSSIGGEYEKLNWATRLGYSFLLFSSQEIETASCLPFIRDTLCTKEVQS